MIALTAGSVVSLSVFTGVAMAQPGEKPISRQATPPSAQPAEQPVGGVKPPGVEAPPAAPAEIDDGKTYPVSRFVLKYLYPHPKQPPIEELEKTEVDLGQGPDGYVRWREGLPKVRVKLADIADGPVEVYSESAVGAVIDALLQRMNQLGVVGVYIFASPDDVKVTNDKADPTHGDDLRPQGQTTFRLEVFTGTVSQVRTLASGERIPFEARIDHPSHRRIRERSPVQPAATPSDPDRKDLINKQEIDKQLFRLNRHPGRRVDVALTSGVDVETEQGTKVPSVSLDYLVTENKPWTAYFQVSNTGTQATEVWRERFGFVHNQLTGRDDILSLDYITGGFQETHAGIASYEARMFDSDTLRGRVYGTWSTYDASDVGLADANFSGDSWSAGAEAIWNVFQHRELFIDVIGGAKWQYINVENELNGIEGDSDFLLPYIGVQLEKFSELSTTSALLNFEFNAPSIANTDENLNALGRIGADDSWVAMQWDVTHSFYLEPLLGRKKWLDTTNGTPTLAHELAFTFKGQYAFGSRLVPNYEQVAGGLYTVRGYPESAAAGDGVIIGSAEYRFHLPRAMKWNTQTGTLMGKPFRWRPQQPYGSADWDFVVRGFFDVGQTIISDFSNAEEEETLMGTGVGVEFVFKRNFNLRVDWGMVLNRLEADDVDVGDSRFHIIGTILF